MTATATLHHPISPISELTRDLSPDAQALAIPAIQRVLNQARYYDQCQAEARELAYFVERTAHLKPAPCIETRGCERCRFEWEEQRTLADRERTRLLLTGRAA